MGEQILGDGPALALLANKIGLVRFNVVEKCLAERRRAADQLDRAGGYTGARHVEQDEADALVLAAAVIGAHQAENPVGLVGVTGPDFLAVDQVVITLVLGPGGQAGEVGARVGLGVALAPADFTAGDFGQMFQFLLLVAEMEQRRAQHGDAETVEWRARADPGHLLPQDFQFLLVEATTAVFLRPVRHGPAARRHAVAPDFLVGMVDLGIAPAVIVIIETLDGCAHGSRAVFLQPGSCFLAELF